MRPSRVMAPRPLLWASRMVKRVTNREDLVVLGVLALTAAINAVDLLPNSSFTMIPSVYSGILAGYLQYLGREHRKRASPAAGPTDRGS